MKKVFAFALTVLMLFSMTAVAEGFDDHVHLIITDVDVYAGTEAVAIKGVKFGLDVNEQGLRVHIDSAAQTAAEAVVSIADDSTLVLKLAGLLSNTQNVYGFDLKSLAGAAGVDLDIDANAAMSATSSMDLSDDVLARIFKNQTLDHIELEAADYVVDGKTISIPADSYVMQRVDLDNDDMIEIMSMMSDDVDVEDLRRELNESHTNMSGDVLYYTGDYMDRWYASMDVMDKNDVMQFIVDVTHLFEDDVYVISFSTVDLDGSVYNIEFSAFEGSHDDAWTVGNVNDAVMLTSMSVENMVSELENGAMGFVMDAVSAVVTGMMAY